MLNLTLLRCGLLILLVVTACSTKDTVVQKKTVDETYAEAMSALADDDLTEALSHFDVIKLQYPASKYADDAQYHIAEINFKRGEFVMAAYNFSVVRRSFPSSEWSKPSAYKVGECYEELMLPPDRDQEYAKKAIQAYTEFQQLYPTDSLALLAVQRIHAIRNHLAQRFLIIAEHYVKTNSNRAALIYFQGLIDEYPDSDVLEDALIGKINALIQQQQYAECKTTIEQYRRMIKEPKRIAEVQEIERNIP